MKMGNKPLISVLLLLLSCTKTDEFTSSSDLEEIKIPNPIPQGDTIVTWDYPIGTFPNTMHIQYKKFRVAENEVWHGTKHISLLTNPNTANIGDTTTSSILENGFAKGCVRGDSVSWKNTSEVVIKYVTQTGYNTTIDCVFKNGNSDTYGRSQHSYSFQTIDDSTERYTGTAMGRDRIKWKVFLWQSEIIEPVILRNGYPISGKIRYELDDDGEITAQVLDYGDGVNDIFATLTIYGVTHDIILPQDLPGVYQFFYGNYE